MKGSSGTRFGDHWAFIALRTGATGFTASYDLEAQMAYLRDLRRVTRSR